MNRRLLVYALLLIGIAGSLMVTVERIHVESRNKAVEIVLDYDEILQVAAATGHSPADVLKQFKEAGATSVAITEQTVGDLCRDGVIEYNLKQHTQNGPFLLYAKKDLTRLVHNLNTAIPSLYARARYEFAEGDSGWISVANGIPISYLNEIPIGFPDNSLEQVKGAGLIPVARLISYPGLTPNAINTRLKEIKSDGINTIIFYGDQVYGFKGAVKSTAIAIAANGLYLGRVEFSKQKGDQRLAEKAVANTITVHSIAGDEMPKMDLTSIVERFQKAVRERGVRMCYVRMYESSSDDILRDNANYVQKISRAITKAGYTMRDAHPIAQMQVRRALRIITALGVAAGILLLILSIVELSAGAMIWWTIGLVVFCAGMAGAAKTGREAVALLSAMVFPTLAAINAVSNTPESPSPAPRLVWQTLGRLLTAVLTVAAGGFLIVGLLSERSYMLRVDQFMGVKLAHLMPVVVLAAVFAGGIAWKSGAWEAQVQLLKDRVKSFAGNPVLVWQAAATLVVLVIVGLMVARSGNDSGVGVSTFELKFRSILDKVLYVRPRTKEFLLGYPALMLGIAFALRGLRQYAAPLIVFGSIGLISALNTFCHIHTPIELSLLRVVNGVWVGGLIGLIAIKLLVRGK